MSLIFQFSDSDIIWATDFVLKEVFVDKDETLLDVNGMCQNYSLQDYLLCSLKIFLGALFCRHSTILIRIRASTPNIHSVLPDNFFIYFSGTTGFKKTGILVS